MEDSRQNERNVNVPSPISKLDHCLQQGQKAGWGEKHSCLGTALGSSYTHQLSKLIGHDDHEGDKDTTIVQSLKR